MSRTLSSQLRSPALRLLLALCAVLFMPLTGTTATGTTLLSFSNQPLFLSGVSKSNLIMALDNSGSTDWEISVKSYNGELWWNSGSETSCSTVGFSGCDAKLSGSSYVNTSASTSVFNVNPSGTGFDGGNGYAYVIPNGSLSDYALAPLPQLAFGRSSTWNGEYFDPTKTYTPWETSTGTSIGNVSPTAAPNDPSNSGTPSATATPAFNLTNDQYGLNNGSAPTGTTCESVGSTGTTSSYNSSAYDGGQSQWTFHVRKGMTIPSGTCVWSGKTTTTISTSSTSGSCSGTSGSNKCSGTNSSSGGCSHSNISTIPTLGTGQAFTSGPTCTNLGKSSVTASWTVTTTTTTTTTGNNWQTANQNVAVGGTTGVNGTSNVIAADTASAIADGTEVSIRYYAPTFWLPADTASPYASYKTSGLATPTIPGTVVGTSSLGKDQTGARMDGYEIKSANFTNQTEYNTAIQNYANWFSYYRKRILAVKNGIGSAFNSLTTPLRLYSFAIGSYNSLSTTSNLMLDSSSATDLATFYTNVYKLNASGGTPDREAIRAIGTQFRRKDSNAPIQSVCQKNFGFLFTDGYANALSGSATYSGVTASPTGNVDGASAITGSLASAGFGTNPYKDSVAYTMADEAMYDYAVPLRNDSASGINYNGATSVPLQAACNGSTTPPAATPWLDCNNTLHMVFYGVILNTLGFVYDGTTSAVANAYSTTPTWPTSTALGGQSPAQVDDLFHATLNSRGQLLNATSPDDIATKISSIVQAITAQSGSASSVSINTTSIQSGSAVFVSSFYNGDWSGSLKRYSLVTTAGTTQGQLNSSPDWDAQTWLDTPANLASRVILTYNPTTYAGVAFQWANLSANEQTLLNLNVATSPFTADTNGSARLSYLRGTRTQEASNANPRFRARGHVLGDIVNSSPFYVGAPNAVSSDASYATFASTYASRTPMVYVAANDGMLHGFDATSGNSGAEKIAYVPSSAFGVLSGTNYQPGLAVLTNLNYQHQFVVDGSPTAADAKVNGSWKTVLVGGMRQGGQGLFALDVTDPSKFSETNAKSLVLWEFTDADDPDLGFTFSQPSIVQMANGQWAAIIGNGYNNTSTQNSADANVSSTNAGKGVLFIIMLNGPTGSGTGSHWKLGTDYFKIIVGSGTTTVPNGLADPAAVDINNDGIADYIYAGDLLGNLWRFNVTDTNPSNWKAAYDATTPVFTAKDTTGSTQAITERPDVGFNTLAPSPTLKSKPQLVVYFGTGRYIDQSDTATTGQLTQTFYGVFDRFDDVASGASSPKVVPTRDVNGGGTYNMVRQQITAEVTAAGGACSTDYTTNCYRVTTTNTVSNTTNQGWYIDLINSGASSPANGGERQTTAPVLRGGTIIFTTMIPTVNSCSGGGTGWLMELNAATGARLPSPAIDINQNGTIDSGDTVAIVSGSTTTQTVSSGSRSTIGFLATPAFEVLTPTTERKYIGGSQAKVSVVLESANRRNGRITWREITP